jgi:tetratricopeptide (TPR) repeat protein
MYSILPVVYVAFLLVLLGGAGWAIFRQVMKTRKVETQISKLQSKLSKEKGTAQEYYELGAIFLDKKLFAQAIAQFQKALKLENLEAEENARIYNALGFAHFSQEQYDLAIRNYKEALKTDPNYTTALNNLGHVYERKQLTAQALEAYEQVLKQEPKNSIAKRRAESLRKRLVPSA